MKFARITQDGCTRMYDIRFKYTPVVRDGKAVIKTTCNISLINPDRGVSGRDAYTFVSHGNVVQHSRDTFTKAEGRKRALTKALAPFARHDRKTAWKVYFSEVKDNHADKKELALT